MNKDHTKAEVIRELLRLKKVGMDFGLNIILGCAGSGHGEENARETADLLNKTQAQKATG